MNASTSECSSGCESGWTVYLDHLSNSTDPCFDVKNYQANDVNYDDQEDEHLSTVSDASSGPPPPDYEVYEGKKKSNRQKNKKKEPKISKNQQNLCLDGTATSPFFDSSQGNERSMEHVPGYSQPYSAAHFENESGEKKHLGFFKSSAKGRSSSLLGSKRH